MSVSSFSTRSSWENLNDSLYVFSEASVPDTLAPPVAGPMVWEGGELKDYVVQLLPSDVDAIRHAVIFFKLSKLPREKISKEVFPLPASLSDKLSAISKEVHNGQGVVVIRGLGTPKFNDEESVIGFAGVVSHIFPLRASDSFANQALSRIWDAKAATGGEDVGLAGSKIPVAMGFHSDRFSGDILALHVQNDGGAQKGGEQFVSSFWKIYNTLLETDPAVLETMAASDWPFELKQTNDAPPHLDLGPTLFFSRGKPMCQLVKAPLLGTPQLPRDPTMPDLSAEQMHALDVIENLAHRFSAKLDRQQGDIQLINNLSIMHARSAYGEKNKPSDRLLLRMFLRDPEHVWDKPATWSNKFDNPFTPGRPQELPIEDTDPRRKISGRESHG